MATKTQEKHIVEIPKNGKGRASRSLAPMPTRNDLDLKIREQMIELLQAQLADTFDMVSMAKQAHWNVRGRHFMSLHLLFDQLHETLEPFVDTIAERLTALGGVAQGTVRMAAGSSRLKEYPLNIHRGEDHLREIADRLAVLGASTREAVDTSQELGDEDSGDMFIDISREIDKYLWFVEAHLDEGP